MVTDVIQAVLLLLGATALTLIAIYNLPEIGIHSLSQFKEAIKPDQMSMIHDFKNSVTGNLNEYSWVSVLLGYPILGIWYWCTDQTIVQKVLGARSELDGQKGAIFAGFLKILPLFLMVLPGVLAPETKNKRPNTCLDWSNNCHCSHFVGDGMVYSRWEIFKYFRGNQ